MKTKHTKGEWDYSPMKGQVMHCTCAQVWDSEGKNLAVIDSRYGEEEATANAKLIAAAPELLEACMKAIELVKLWGAQSFMCVDASSMHELQALKDMENSLNNAINKATK